MGKRLNEGSEDFAGVDLTSIKANTIIDWTNSLGRDLNVGLLVSATGLQTTGQTFELTMLSDAYQVGSGVISVDILEKDHEPEKASADSTMQFSFASFQLIDGARLVLKLLSSDGNDTDIAGNVYLLDNDAGIDVRVINGNSPQSDIATETKQDTMQSDVTFVKNMSEADTETDTTGVVYQELKKIKNTATVLSRKNMTTVAGADITSDAMIIGNLKDPGD